MKLLKERKLLVIIAAAGACALLVFSIFIFPLIIASTPENLEIKTILSENQHPTDEMEQYNDNEEYDDPNEVESSNKTERESQLESITMVSAIFETTGLDSTVVNVIGRVDINAITEEAAIDIAQRAVMPTEDDAQPTVKRPAGETITSASEFRSTRYYQSVDHIDDPVWQVLFYVRTWGFAFIYPDDSQTVSVLLSGWDDCCFETSLDRDLTGETAVKLNYDLESIEVVEVNALTGKIIGKGEIVLCDHIKSIRTFSYDKYTDWLWAKEYDYFIDMSQEILLTQSVLIINRRAEVTP